MLKTHRKKRQENFEKYDPGGNGDFLKFPKGLFLQVFLLCFLTLQREPDK